MDENKNKNQEDFYAAVSAITRFIETADSDAVNEKQNRGESTPAPPHPRKL